MQTRKFFKQTRRVIANNFLFKWRIVWVCLQSVDAYMAIISQAEQTPGIGRKKNKMLA